MTLGELVSKRDTSRQEENDSVKLQKVISRLEEKEISDLD
jgi:hypothetical protein